MIGESRCRSRDRTSPLDSKPKGLVLPLPEVGGVGRYPGTLPKLPAAPGGFHTERRREHGPDYTEKPGFRESVNGTWIHG